MKVIGQSSRLQGWGRGFCGVHLLVVVSLAAPGCPDGRSPPVDGDAWDGPAPDGDGGFPDGEGDREPDGGEWETGDGDVDPWADWDPDPRCAHWAGLEGEPLRQELFWELEQHQSISYDHAREVMFSEIDNQQGQVQCVYTGEWVLTQGIPDPEVMNTEHTWCQSWGADTQPARSDLNHLFPALSYVNNRRSNTPFGSVVEIEWEAGGSLLGRDAIGRTVFEPRDPHKGDCARAMFYFSVRYQMELADFMEEILRAWNRRDLPDHQEQNRNAVIEEIQKTRNPFVDCPELIDRIPDF